MHAAEATAVDRVLGTAVLYHKDNSGNDSLASPDFKVSQHQMPTHNFTLDPLALVSGTSAWVKSSWEDGAWKSHGDPYKSSCFL